MTGPMNLAATAMALALIVGCGGGRSNVSQAGELSAEEARRAASTDDMVEQALVYETNAAEGDDSVALIPAATTSDPEKNPIHKSRQNFLRKQLKKHGQVIAIIRKIAREQCADLIPTGNKSASTRKAVLTCVQEKAVEADKPKLAEVIGKIISEIDNAILEEQGSPTLESFPSN